MDIQFKKYGDITYHISDITNLYDLVNKLNNAEINFIKKNEMLFIFRKIIDENMNKYFQKSFVESIEELTEFELSKFEKLVIDSRKQNLISYSIFKNDKEIKKYFLIFDVFLQTILVRYKLYFYIKDYNDYKNYILKLLDSKMEFLRDFELYEDFFENIFRARGIINDIDIDDIEINLKIFLEKIPEFMYMFDSVFEEIKKDMLFGNQTLYNLGLYYLFKNLKTKGENLNNFYDEIIKDFKQNYDEDRKFKISDIFTKDFSNNEISKILFNTLKMTSTFGENPNKVMGRNFIKETISQDINFITQKLINEIDTGTNLNNELILLLDKTSKLVSSIRTKKIVFKNDFLKKQKLQNKVLLNLMNEDHKEPKTEKEKEEMEKYETDIIKSIYIKSKEEPEITKIIEKSIEKNKRMNPANKKDLLSFFEKVKKGILNNNLLKKFKNFKIDTSKYSLKRFTKLLNNLSFNKLSKKYLKNPLKLFQKFLKAKNMLDKLKNFEIPGKTFKVNMKLFQNLNKNSCKFFKLPKLPNLPEIPALYFKLPRFNLDFALRKFHFKIKLNFHFKLNLSFGGLLDCLKNFMHDLRLVMTIIKNPMLFLNKIKDMYMKQIEDRINRLKSEYNNIKNEIKGFIKNLKDQWKKIKNLDVKKMFNEFKENLKNTIKETINDVENQVIDIYNETKDEILNAVDEVETTFVDMLVILNQTEDEDKLINEIDNQLGLNDDLGLETEEVKVSEEELDNIPVKELENVDKEYFDVKEVEKLEENLDMEEEKSLINITLKETEMMKDFFGELEELNELSKDLTESLMFLCDLSKLSCMIGKIRNLLNGKTINETLEQLERDISGIIGGIKGDFEEAIRTDVLGPINNVLEQFGISADGFNCCAIAGDLATSAERKISNEFSKISSIIEDNKMNLQSCQFDTPTLGNLDLGISFDNLINLDLSELEDLMPEFNGIVPEC